MPLRACPYGSAAAHTLGRVGEISEAQLNSKGFEGLESGDLVGQAGIELQYNRHLMGQDGLRSIIVNSRGLEVNLAKYQPPVDGPQLTLTLDIRLQKVLEQALAGKTGCGVALDPETGEILAMSSSPSYDPNRFSSGIDQASWQNLIRDPTLPLMNRVIQGQYAPGSLFKIVVALAALEEKVITPETTVFCPGYISFYGTVFHCHNEKGHGAVNLRRALALSCNVFFYQTGVRLEIDRIARYAKRLGLGETTGVDLPYEMPGLIPSAAWKLLALKAPWYAGETVSVAIGQGQVSVTPLQMARLAAFVANGGRLVRPHLVRSIGDMAQSNEKGQDLGFRPEVISAVRDGMCAVVNERGTGWRAQVQDFAVCGKTGSAQVIARGRQIRLTQPEAAISHAWFVGFAPAEKPRIAVAVLIEHGGAGGEAAAPVVQQVLTQYRDILFPASEARVQSGN